MKSARGLCGLDLVVRPNRVEASLWRRFRFEAEPGCREMLFDRYAALARSIAGRHGRRWPASRADRFDLEQFAYEGLLQAIDRYDPLNGASFGAFASRRIAGSISDGVAAMSEIGAQVRNRHRLEQERLRSLADGKSPGADALGDLSSLAIGLALGLMLEGTALVAGAGEADTAPGPYDSLEWRETQVRLAREVARLPSREATIIRHHYDTGLSFAQIADLLGLSRGRISQLHRAALEKLRNRLGALV